MILCGHTHHGFLGCPQQESNPRHSLTQIDLIEPVRHPVEATVVHLGHVLVEPAVIV